MPIITTEDEQHLITLTDTCADGDAIGLNSSGQWVRADANATQPIRAEFFALKGTTVNPSSIKVARRVKVQNAAAYTAGALQFLSATAGGHTATNPVAVLTLVQCLGRAISADEAILDAGLEHLTVPFALVSTLPATAANYGNIFVADRCWRLIAAREAHAVVGSDGGAVTLDIEKLANTEALDAGVVMLAATFDLKGTANTEQAKAPSATVANARLKPGDRVALKDAGVLTVVAGLSGSLTFVEDL